MLGIIRHSVRLAAPAEAPSSRRTFIPTGMRRLPAGRWSLQKRRACAFSAFKGAPSGTMLTIVEPKSIVQSWELVGVQAGR